jgi:hypothetical protein
MGSDPQGLTPVTANELNEMFDALTKALDRTAHGEGWWVVGN